MSDSSVQLTSYEKLVRLALQVMLVFSLVSLACALPWRGLLTATSNPLQLGIEPSQTYIALRVALQSFPFVVLGAGGIGWILFFIRRYRVAFYVGVAGVAGLALIVLTILFFTLFMNIQ